jgi:hypothetical protein
MKKITCISCCLLTATLTNAQLFSDNFDSYTLGALGPQSTSWTTWSTTEGGAEDGIVSNAKANSGANSIYFSSTAIDGGPQDCVLKFGQIYNSGIFTFQADFYVTAGKSSYFNFQAGQNVGSLWALNVNMANGGIVIDDGITASLCTGAYPAATWFTLKINANLSLGNWEAFVNNVSIGTWANGVNALSSADIFPLQGSDFYVDNVSFNSQPYTLPTKNVTAMSLTSGASIVGNSTMPSLKVKNTGATAITSLAGNLTYNGNNYPFNLTGLNIASLATYTATMPSITLVAGTNNAVATITSVNGSADDVTTDNTATLGIQAITPATGKVVVVEEATGTWCGYCPRGAIGLKKYDTNFGNSYVGIAVHNNDPMAIAMYDTGMSGFITGFPSAIVDRGAEEDPIQLDASIIARLQVAPKAFIVNGATWNATTRVLNVSVSANFQAAVTSAYKLACVITEDSVKGTGAGWSQVNYYAGGSNGVMGGFELLSNPVPAGQMTYDHVARGIQPSFTGYANSFPATVSAGQTHTVNFTFTLPSTWNASKMHIVGLLINPAGKIDNAGKSTIAEAVANGYTNGVNLGLEEENIDQLDAAFTIYPNPTQTHSTITVQLNQLATVGLRLLDVSGKELTARNYGSMSGASTIDLNTSALNAGIYLVELSINNQKMVKRLIVE